MPKRAPIIFAVALPASVVFIALLSPLTARELLAQSAAELSQVKKLYVAPVGGGAGARELHASLVKQLRKAGHFQIVETPAQADAVIKGTGQLWITGYISVNPRASKSSRQSVYGGFLSVEVRGKGNEVLWSYLVTPNRFSGGNVADDLAGNLTKQLIAAQGGRKSPGLSIESSDGLDAATLHGAGATLPAPLYLKWFESFSEKHPSIQIQYDGVGSEEGLRLLTEEKVDFAGSDVLDTTSQPPFLRVPTVLGGVVPIYKVKNVGSNLRFTPEMLAGIYLGKIKKWNDPLIGASNNGIALPDADIVVIHRSDGSGTTYTWSDFLSKISTDWKSTVGTAMTLTWPVGSGAEHNEGVAALVQKTPNSIGYVELVYAIQHQLSFGSVRNASGEFIHASLESLALAARDAAVPSSQLPTSITNAAGKGAYPIATFTWLLVPPQVDDPAKKAALLALLHWLLADGQKECSALGYAPLPRDLAERVLNSLRAR